MRHEPSGDLSCDDCGSNSFTAIPYPDMDETISGSTPRNIVVPVDCDECGAHHEAVYELEDISR